jgi:nicotinamidase-related amidase
MSNPRSALLVIDVQKGLFAKSTPIYAADKLLDNILALVKRARAAGVPVIYVQHCGKTMLMRGSDDWQLHPRLKPSKKDLVLCKTHASAFADTPLQDELRARRISRLFVTGLVTHGCVQATCRDAKSRGYEVVLVKDGHSNYHRHANLVIVEWNAKLSQDTVALQPAKAVQF